MISMHSLHEKIRFAGHAVGAITCSDEHPNTIVINIRNQMQISISTPNQAQIFINAITIGRYT